ncbi:HI0074 family nucleotidyltransferase substrate-binding subunit [endosymbiont GvMRE of Glomus versiforme]|uniref:HI0074 family nucleotidyltransferase substrate-binding subunit n=1 Tax=endosymbiont GvMRE of Glomus versiforme TaxID=2039283 RepID=UPI000EDC9D00|nr:HI0074 family nucleotidyltransferase substrate-binding subunit [endosymbiont GvMRE of Glomus versiforme]RHZ35545.1 Nucleotidyltransferase substrate binding protein [endosymbiont GvMRE of Glomus versiforme]
MAKQYFYGEVDYSSLVKVRNTLNRILQTSQNEAEKMGVVKAFEICYELSWKIMKKILEFQGVEVGTARDVFREAARLKLLIDAENWFVYIKKRNITSSCLPTRDFGWFIYQYCPRIFARFRLFIKSNRKGST